MVPATVVVMIGEINSGDGLGNGHGFVVRDVFSIGHIWYRVKWFGIYEGFVENERWHVGG